MINQDWAADVRKYVPDADEATIAGIVRYCGIALRKVDSSLVSFSDPKETARVRDGYCRKKLGLTDSDAVVDAAIAAVGERMKEDRTKNRVTVYYLLAEHFGKLGVFAGKAKGGAGAGAAGAAGAAIAATAMGAAGAAAMTASDAPAAPVRAAPPPPPPAPPPPAPAPAPDPVPEPVAVAEPATAAPTALMGAVGAVAATGAAAAAATRAPAPATPAERADDSRQAAAAAGWSQPAAREPTGGFMFGAAAAVIGLILLAALVAWFISSRMGSDGDAAPVVSAAPAAPAPAAPAPAPAPTPPEGAGVVATEVAGRPMVSVYFDTARADIAADFETAVAPVVAWLAANPGDMAQVSGFNDPRGDAAFNADLSRRRAEGVAEALRRLGVPEQQIDLEPPASATDATTDLAGARRVEITVVPLS